jgi:hypothetical protein
MTARRRLSRFALGLIAITIVGFGVRVAFILTEAPDKVDDLGGDAYYYHHAANLLADGKGFIDPYRYNFGYVEDVVLESGEAKTIVLPVGFESPTAGHPPVYATYLAFFSELGLRSVRAHQFASAVLGCASIVLAGLLGRSLLGDRAGLVGAGITAVYANVWLNDGIVMSETAAIAFAFLTTLLGLRFWRGPTLARGAWFAAAGGLAALSRAELVLFIPIVGAVALLRAPLPWRTRILRYGAMGAVAVAVVAPWVIRNNLVMNEPVLLSNGAGTVAVQANCDDTYYGRYIGYWSLRCGGTQPVGPNGEFLDESERDVVVRERAAEYISSRRGSGGCGASTSRWTRSEPTSPRIGPRSLPGWASGSTSCSSRSPSVGRWSSGDGGGLCSCSASGRCWPPSPPPQRSATPAIGQLRRSRS